MAGNLIRHIEGIGLLSDDEALSKSDSNHGHSKEVRERVESMANESREERAISCTETYEEEVRKL